MKKTLVKPVEKKEMATKVELQRKGTGDECTVNQGNCVVGCSCSATIDIL